jgi:hypothetical protein
MGYVGYFYVESKSYELRLCDGSRNIKLTEWGRLNLSTVFLGEVRLVWLLKMMNELVLETTSISACRDHRMNSNFLFVLSPHFFQNFSNSNPDFSTAGDHVGSRGAVFRAQACCGRGFRHGTQLLC